MIKNSGQNDDNQTILEELLSELRRLNDVAELGADSMRSQQEKISTLERQLSAIRGSSSYKTGRMLARLVAPLRGGRTARFAGQIVTAPEAIKVVPRLNGTLAIPQGPKNLPVTVETDAELVTIPEGLSPLEALNTTYPVMPGSEVSLSISSQCFSGGPRSGLVQMVFFDDNKQAVVPSGMGSAHPTLGEYRYLPDGLLGPETVFFDIQIPPRATQMQIIGHQWKKGSSTGVLQIELISTRDVDANLAGTLEEFIGSIGINDHLIIIYSTAPPLGHDTLALRPNRLAREYALSGSFVIFMPFGSLQGHSPQQGDRLWQAEGHRLSEVLDLTSSRKGKNTVFICSSYPDVRCATSVDNLVARGWNYVYEVRDEMEEFNRVGYSKWFKPHLEAYVAQRSTSVVTVSPRLAEKIDIIAACERSIVVPNGVTDELVSRTSHLRDMESWNTEPPRTKIGYIGHLTPSWFDWRSVLRLAAERPDLEFEIIGHGTPDGLQMPGNVRLLGPRTHDECSDAAASWSVGLIPFLPTPLTTAVDPNKLYEYLSMGLKVVSIEMGSVNESPLTWVYQSPEELEQVLTQALDHCVSAEDLNQVERFLNERTWSERAVQMYSIFGGVS